MAPTFLASPAAVCDFLYLPIGCTRGEVSFRCILDTFIHGYCIEVAIAVVRGWLAVQTLDSEYECAIKEISYCR